MLLDDMGVRFWKCMHRLRNALGRAPSQHHHHHHGGGQEAGERRTVVPGAGEVEAIMISALRRRARQAQAGTARRQRAQGNAVAVAGDSGGALMEPDVLLSLAQVLSDHLLQLLLNSGLRLESALDRLGKYLGAVNKLVGPVLDIEDPVVRRAAWAALRGAMPTPVLTTAYMWDGGDGGSVRSGSAIVLDDRRAKMQALIGAVHVASLLSTVDGVLTNYPCV